jgi:ribosomal protein L11 methyltransferase
LRAVVSVADADVAAGDLWDAGAAGIEERSVKASEGAPAMVELLAGVPAARADAALAAVGGRWPVDATPVEGEEWLDAWREWARPWRAGSRLVVVPAWLEVPAWAGADDLVLCLDPGRAFGSGAHATTRLCLAELEHRVRPGARVLDVGTGSGVLALAAARLGATHVEAVDIAPDAVEAASGNADRNGVADRVHPSLTPIEDVAGEFDVVVANIGAATLTALAPHLVAAVRPGGTLVLSGVLAEQVEVVAAAVTGVGVSACATAADGEWRALVFARPGDPELSPV